MAMIISLIASMIAVWVTAYILPGVEVEGLSALLVTVVVLGVLNMILKPILLLLTLPVNLLTLGLFTFVINALVIMLTSSLVAGFEVGGFLNALLFSIVMSVVNAVLNSLMK